MCFLLTAGLPSGGRGKFLSCKEGAVERMEVKLSHKHPDLFRKGGRVTAGPQPQVGTQGPGTAVVCLLLEERGVSLPLT